MEKYNNIITKCGGLKQVAAKLIFVVTHYVMYVKIIMLLEDKNHIVNLI
jgi:hypothetical protein